MLSQRKWLEVAINIKWWLLPWFQNKTVYSDDGVAQQEAKHIKLNYNRAISMFIKFLSFVNVFCRSFSVQAKYWKIVVIKKRNSMAPTGRQKDIRQKGQEIEYSLTSG